MKSADMLECIRVLVRERKYIITTHAIIRMSDRDVTTKDLISLIANGEIIEAYPNRKPCPAALMLGFISDKPCHAVVAICGDRLSIITVYWLDGLQNEEIMTSSDMCALCGGKLHEGFTELVMKIGNEVVVIKKVPALVCSCCGEAYVTPDVSEKIDEVMKEYRAGKILARPLAAGEIELKMSA